MRKYPVGIQDFGEIRSNGYLYIDKTQLLHQLIDEGKFYFLSRPRRMGKSLLLSTLKEIFSGKAQLFKGLWIEHNWDWTRVSPVIHIRFSKMPYQSMGLNDAINLQLSQIAAESGLVLTGSDIKSNFEALIVKLAAKGEVVILIDEYDKAVIDYLDNLAKAMENMAILKSLFSVLKDADPYIRLLFMTGVSKFAKVSIFSDLNNLNDLTLHPRFTTLTGITQQELEANFADEMQQLALSNPTVQQDVRRWYNGYSWDGINKVYNPFSLLSFFHHGGVFQNFWFETGTPTFLINQLTKHQLYNFEGIESGGAGLSNFNIENLSPITLLFQTGYITIKRYDTYTRVYELGYPNMEVKESLHEYLIGAYRTADVAASIPLAVHLYRAFEGNNIAAVIDVINTAFATIPYHLWRNASELNYHALVHLTFVLLGNYLQSEVNSANGRCDAVVTTATHVYAIEFKLDGSEQAALQQVLDKGYLDAYQLSGKKRVAIGINFSSIDKKVAGWEILDLL